METTRTDINAAGRTRPETLLVFDPDSRASAYCIARLNADATAYVAHEVDGGGNPAHPVAWQDTHGLRELLLRAVGDADPSTVLVAVETQAVNSPWAQDCEQLFAFRYRLATLCDLQGVRCLHVEPATWMRATVPGAFRGTLNASVKRAYRAHARGLFGAKLAANEDRCAAICVTQWLAAELGCYLRVRP